MRQFNFTRFFFVHRKKRCLYHITCLAAPENKSKTNVQFITWKLLDSIQVHASDSNHNFIVKSSCAKLPHFYFCQVFQVITPRKDRTVFLDDDDDVTNPKTSSSFQINLEG